MPDELQPVKPTFGRAVDDARKDAAFRMQGDVDQHGGSQHQNDQDQPAQSAAKDFVGLFFGKIDEDRAAKHDGKKPVELPPDQFGDGGVPTKVRHAQSVGPASLEQHEDPEDVNGGVEQTGT